MKLLLDTLLVFAVMMIAAALVAWGEPGEGPRRSDSDSLTELPTLNLVALLGLR